MRALVADGRGGVVFADVPTSQAAPDEVLIDVGAVSLNRGELHRLDDAEGGWRPGWDFAGVVARPAETNGPPVGTRVVGFAFGGSWAERVVVRGEHLASVPDDVTFEQAAALPVAGLTALRLLRVGGDLAGKRVLVTGAAGGVGHFAVQLARRAGAAVTAIVGSRERGHAIADLGADVVVGLAAVGRFELILESIGGDALARALELVAPRGTVVSFGNSSRQQTTFWVNGFYAKQAALRGYYLLDDIEERPAADDLMALLELVAAGELQVDVGAVFDWEDASLALERLRARAVAGKAVLCVAPGSLTAGAVTR